MNTTPLTPRQIAKSQNQIRYIGMPCIHGHTGERYVRNHACVQCHTSTKNNPPKTPKTDFEKWIKRSRSSRRAKTTRKALSVEYYKNLYTSHCPLLGIELSYGAYIGAIPKNYASLDKIDPQKGYVEGNVQIISFRANTIKNSSTLEEMRMIVNNWEKSA